MLKETEAAAEAENILIQETTDESENDFNYEY